MCGPLMTPLTSIWSGACEVWGAGAPGPRSVPAPRPTPSSRGVTPTADAALCVGRCQRGTMATFAQQGWHLGARRACRICQLG